MNMSVGSERVPIRVTVNGQVHEREVEARQLLVDLLRETLGLTARISVVTPATAEHVRFSSAGSR